jgi:hypothetical protein
MRFLISHWQNQSYQEAQSDETKEEGFQDICYECALEIYTKHYPGKKWIRQISRPGVNGRITKKIILKHGL